MCGIAGFITQSNKYNFKSLSEMINSINHRGPDARGFFIDPKKGIYLAHCRLSIIDLSKNANQPLTNEKNTIYLIYNGEIYNFKSLKNYLIKKGHQFRSKTDGEILIHLYEEEGLKFLHKLNGMFVFALFDKIKHRLILARDRIGIKPLYYFLTNQIFSFASEIKAFKPLGEFSISKFAIENLLRYQFLPNNHLTILKNIYKLPPGHFLIYNLSNRNFKIKKYWKLSINKKIRNLNFNEALETFENLLIKSIKLRLIADVKIGIMLSGGVDSSLIAALSSKFFSKQIFTFTAGFESKIDERKWAKKVADFIGSTHTELILNLSEIIKDIENIAFYFDDLSSFDAGLITNYLIAKEIRKRGIKVILLGEGADEIFGGYSWFGLSQIPFKFFPLPVKKFLFYYAISRNYSFDPISSFKEFNKILKSFSKEIKNFFDLISYFEITFQLPNHYLMKVDKGSMMASIEARVPYLDHNLVEFGYSLSPSFKLKGKTFSFKNPKEKYLLRKLASKYLPSEIAFRKKKGGMFPVSDFIKLAQSKIKDYLLSKNSLAIEIFGRKKIEKLLKDPINLGKSNWNFKEVEREIFLWKLFLLELWRNSLKV